MPNKICVIGNYGHNTKVYDGGSIKIRLYCKILKELGNEVMIIDLDGWKKSLIKIFLKIIRNVSNNDVILIMGGPSGSRHLIPLVNFFNVKHVRTVYCPLGTGVAEKITNKLDKDKAIDFLSCTNFYNLKDKKMMKNLKKMSIIIPQNEFLCNFYSSFYHLNNVKLVRNFRDVDENFDEKSAETNDYLSVVFLSRVCEEKGIFLLMDAVNEINNDGNIKIKLDIYGKTHFLLDEEIKFKNKQNDFIKYKGTVNNDNSIKTIRNYDLFCLPTNYMGEGTPGSLIESKIAGVPCLVSSYSQAKYLVEDNINGFIFKINDLYDLKNKLIYIANNRELLVFASKNAKNDSKKYLFKYNKIDFEKAILGNEL